MSTQLNLENLNDSSASENVYEAYRQRKLLGNKRTKLVYAISTVLSIGVSIVIGLVQYDEYFAFINDRLEYINQSKQFCSVVTYDNISIISSAIAGALLFFYIFLFKRRFLLRNKFKYRNIGLPMMVSCWSKTNRVNSSFTYGLMAINVFYVIRNYLLANTLRNKILNFDDPTGLLVLLVKILEVLLVGVRYYPVLVAFRVNLFPISASCALYMWIDFVINVYQYGKCESFEDETRFGREETQRRIGYFFTYKLISAIPMCIFSSFIVTSLTYQAFVNLIYFLGKYKLKETRKMLVSKSKDTLACSICNLEDENEMFYSNCDLDYVLRLLNNEKNKKSKILNIFYDWDPSFRFTSRYLNIITVASVSLLYVFLFWTYRVFIETTYITQGTPDQLDELKIDIFAALCKISSTFCVAKLEGITITIPLPGEYPTYLKDSLNTIFIVPIFVSFGICVIQLFFLIKETKMHLKQMHKGDCDFVRKAKNLKNSSIASSSFHFGGYLVGYLLWAYFIIWGFLSFIGLVILFIRLVGDDTFGSIALKLVPFLTGFIIKKIVNNVASGFIFLDRKTKVLALKRFRPYNVYLYFNFFYDCFMGIVSAFIRLLLSVIVAVFMMPRVSYSFLGRHWERIDSAYSCYSGFIHMESMHTNPILISFCNILYYKELNDHIKYRVRYYKAENKFAKDDIFLKESESNLRITKIKNYNKRILNRWFLYVFLVRNKSLISLRRKDQEILDEKRKKFKIKSAYKKLKLNRRWFKKD